MSNLEKRLKIRKKELVERILIIQNELKRVIEKGWIFNEPTLDKFVLLKELYEQLNIYKDIENTCFDDEIEFLKKGVE